MVVRIVFSLLLLLAGCADDAGPSDAPLPLFDAGQSSAPAVAASDAGSLATDATAPVQGAGLDASGSMVSPPVALHDAGTGPGAAIDAEASAAPAQDAAIPPVLDDSLRITWTRCDTSYECATLQVPVDYGDAASGTLELALKRRPARGQRIGSLLLNPGGPGGSGLDALVGLMPGLTRLNERFDIVGFDPRGVGKSTPITCHDTLQQLIAADPTPDNDAEWAALDRVSQVFADGCAQKYPKLLPHLGTQNVARDMDRIRAGLGEDKLNFLGFSYGTSIGAWYAQLFPKRVRALVLDGAVSQVLSPIEMMLEQAKGFELALSNYFAWCQGSALRCSWTQGKDARQAFDSLSARIEQQPLAASGYDRPAGPGEFALAVIMPLYGGEQGWQLLSLALSRAVRGDGGVLIDLADSYLERGDDGAYANITEVNNAVNCIDHASPSYDEVRANEARFASEAPIFGVATLGALLVCSHWGAALPEPTPPAGEGAAAIVVIGTTHDPATPYAWAESLSSELASAVLLTWEGEGHTAYTRGSSCIDAAVESYFIDGRVPQDGTRCAANAAREASPLLAPAMARRPAPSALVRIVGAGR
jgi:pimeloyl-ACP methyl ester carboxylesterase